MPCINLLENILPQLISRKNKDNKHLYWLGQRGEDALCFSMLRSIEGIICCNYSTFTESLNNNEIEIFSYEKESHHRLPFSSDHLQKLFEKWKRKLSSTKKINLIPYCSINNNFSDVEMWSPNYFLSERLNDKKFQRHCFEKWGLLYPKTISSENKDKLLFISNILDKQGKVICSPIVGSLGKGVIKFSSLEAIKEFFYTNKNYMISEYIEGVPINTSSITTSQQTVTAWPSLQILGEPLCNPTSEFTFCGSDFSSVHDLSKESLNRLWKLTQKLGRCLAGLGYYGMWGADWILDTDNQWYLIEINPRLQGSTLALSLFEKLYAYPPFLDTLLNQFELTEKFSKKLPIQEGFINPIKGFQLVFYAPEEGIHADFKPWGSCSGPTWYLTELPISGTRIDKNAHYFRILAPEEKLPIKKNKISLEKDKSLSYFHQKIALCQNSFPFYSDSKSEFR